eukprot:TRINITY_DN2811_c0_g1_i1.p1 TRINITY_DN2811_c0_g1~~TRINITY_DN2811_c0_g1_i1.p1  ORF type:complete len:161 (-),score=47.03 TRINITY_DN2811_c0_g1_i1:41-523(-)
MVSTRSSAVSINNSDHYSHDDQRQHPELGRQMLTGIVHTQFLVLNELMSSDKALLDDKLEGRPELISRFFATNDNDGDADDAKSSKPKPEQQQDKRKLTLSLRVQRNRFTDQPAVYTDSEHTIYVSADGFKQSFVPVVVKPNSSGGRQFRAWNWYALLAT